MCFFSSYSGEGQHSFAAALTHKLVFSSSRFGSGGAEQPGEPEPEPSAEQTGHERHPDHDVLPGGLQEERPDPPVLRTSRLPSTLSK